MRLNNSLVLLLTFTCVYSAVLGDSFKYLAVLHTPVRSHFSVGESLMKALAAKGHQVFVISSFPQKQPIKNYYDIPLDIEEFRSENPFDSDNFLKHFFKVASLGIERSENVLKHPHVQQLMASNRTFDAVICEVFLSESLYGLSEHFKAPLIGLSALATSTSVLDMVGSPSPPSYVASNLIKRLDPTCLIHRAVNIFTITFERLFMRWYYLPRQADLYNKYFPNATRDMYAVRKNAAAVLANTHTSFVSPRPYMPNHIEVGGMHINRERKPLPEAMQQFIEEAKNGVVYFSMSSNLRDFKMQEFLTAFGKIKQRVLWKYEDNVLFDIPDNVFISDWFPQNDILAHENVKVFITHGGLLSTIESIYHGTPIIGIPIFGGQPKNVERAVADGFAIQLNYDTLNAEDLVRAINLLIYSEWYQQRVKEISARYRDQPLLPRELAVFWAEHIARHKGAKYMHCAGLDLNLLQYHSIDTAITACIILLLFLYLYRCILHLCMNHITESRD